MTTTDLVGLKSAISSITDAATLDAVGTMLKDHRAFLADLNTMSIGAGDTITFTKPLRPTYLIGKMATVTKVNDKTVVVDFADDASLRRYSGAEGVRVPKSCVTAA